MLKIKKCSIVMILILLVNPLLFIQSNTLVSKGAEHTLIEIETVEDLKGIGEALDEHYLLTADIDLKDADWKPIDEGKFTGTFTSGEHTIKNMPQKYVQEDYSGLFESVENPDAVQINVAFAEGPAADDIEKSETEAEVDSEVEEQGEQEEQDESAKSEEATEADQAVAVSEAQVDSKEPEVTETELEEAARTEQIVEEEQLEKEEINKKSKAVTQAEGQQIKVANFTEFKAALEDKAVTEIALTGNVEADGWSWNRINVAPREVVIHGNEKEIKQKRQGSSSMMKVNLEGSDNKAHITFKNVKMVSRGGNSFLTDTGEGVDWQVTFENVNKNGADASIGRLVNSENAHVTFKETVNFETTNNQIIWNAKSVTVAPDSKVTIASKGNASYQSGRFYETDATSAKLLVEAGGTLNLEVEKGDSSLIKFTGDDSKIEVNGGQLNVTSDIVYRGLIVTRNTRSGLINFSGNRAKFEAHNGGKININHLQGSILYMKSENGQMNITGEDTRVLFKVRGDGKDTDHDAVIHFNRPDNYKEALGYELNLDKGSYFEVMKESGAAMGIRVGEGKGHQVNVKGKSKLKIHNKGDGKAADPSGENARNQALYYNGELPEFNLTGKGSEVRLEADNGVAVHMTSGGKINVTEGTTFVARGKTKSADRGIFDTGGVDDKAESKIHLNKPAYYDFKNRNTAGFIFHVGKGAEIIGENTDIAVWPRGENVDLDGPHEARYLGVVRYKYMKADFKEFSEDADSNTSTGLRELHENKHGNGLRDFARITGNNEQAVVNDLYIPTNADKKVYAHVSIEEGAFNKRNAYTDEVEVDILHRYADGGDNLLRGKTLGRDQFPGENVYKIYDKPVDSDIGAFGWVEIELPEDAYLEEGDTLEVDGARILGSESASEEGEMKSDKEHLFEEIRTVFDVTPPEPTEIETTELTNYSRTLKGTLTEEDAKVVVEVNGEDAAGDVEYDRDKETFTYQFKERLAVDDYVQVFLYDNAGAAEALGPAAHQPDRPVTNLAAGNRNPQERLAYHERTFDPAPALTVKEAPGELTFESAPKTLDFTVKVTPQEQAYLVNVDKLGSDLIVRDTRSNKTGWKLAAKMSKQLRATDDDSVELPDALFYQDGNKRTTINAENSLISSHEVETSEDEDKEWNISSDAENGWGKHGNGLFIHIEPGVLKKEYEGEVTWTLSDTP